MSGKTKNANKNEYLSRVRTAEQCFLIANVGSLVNQIREGAQSPSNIPSGFFKKTIMKHSLHKHHIALPGGKNAPNHAEIIGKHFIGNEIATLFDLKTYELSALVPRVNLFRVEMDPVNGKVKNILEFYFDSHTRKDNVKRILDGTSDRFGEAGLIGVNWELLGGQPAEVKRYIQVDMEFFFSSISTLTRERDISEDPNRLSYLDLFRRRGAGEPYRLRLDVGWHLPEKNTHLFESVQRANEVRRAIAKSTKTLWLNLRNHDLKFSQDGTVNLTINYISSLEYDLAKISVIKDTRTKQSKKKQEENLKLARKIYEQTKSDACTPKKSKILWNSKEYKDHEALLKKMKNKIDFMSKMKSQGGLNVLREIDRQLHKKIMVKDSKNVEVARTRVFSVQADKRELGFTSGKIMLKDGWFTNTYGGSNITTGVINYGTLRQSLETKGLKRELKPVFKSGISASITGAIKKRKNSKKVKEYNEQITKLKKSLITDVAKSGNDGLATTTVKYCFLGDLVDATIDACISIYGGTGKGITGQSNLNSILSSMKIVFGNVSIPTYQGDKAQKKIISLADLPVSYNLFNAWFIKHVIDAGKSQFLLKDFIRLLVTQLVNLALGNNCFIDDDYFKNFGRNKVEMSFFTVRIPKTANKAPEIFTGDKADAPLSKTPFYKKRMTKKALNEINFKEADPDNENISLTNYLFITTTNQAMNVRVKNRIKDFETGVFHLNIAQDDGIVKEINFNKAQADYLEEALLNDQKRARELDVFRRVYNADIVSYGNASFIPGQLLYIDPTVVGMGDVTKPVSIARALGLGGYFVVTKVSNSIKSGEFNTNVSTRWVGFGDGQSLFPTPIKKVNAQKKNKIQPCKDKQTSYKKLEEQFNQIEGFKLN